MCIFLRETYFSLIVKAFVVIGKILNLQKQSKISAEKKFLFCFWKIDKKSEQAGAQAQEKLGLNKLDLHSMKLYLKIEVVFHLPKY
jgi:hypothetical protein